MFNMGIKFDILEQTINHKIKNNDYTVKNFVEYNREEILSIFRSFSRQINGIYWPQKESFIKIIKWWDRKTFILELQDKRIWIVTIKDKLQDEYKLFNYKNWYVELKSFFLFDEFWHGHIWKLRDILIKEIKHNFNQADWILVSVSDNKAKRSLNMFKALWFQEISKKENLYLDWDSEIFLYYPL